MIEHFVITDEFGTSRFDVRGRLSLTQRLSLCDQTGRELAEIRKHLMSTRHDIVVDGQAVAQVHHEGFFGEKYEVDSQFGRITAKGDFGGWNYSIHDGHQLIATVSREFALREKFLVDVANDVNDVFILAIVLAIDAIHDERRQN